MKNKRQEVDQMLAEQFLRRVAEAGTEVNPRALEGSIKRSRGTVGYVIEFHKEHSHMFEVLKLIWNDRVLQTYRKSVGHTTGATNFELCLAMVYRLHADSRYPHIEWEKFPY